MEWDDVRIFLAVARSGSISAAGKVLGVNHSTVSRRMQSFEEKIKVRLFEKLNSGYVLTTAGEHLFQSACRVEDELFTVERKILGTDTRLSGVLRVTAPNALVGQTLSADFALFLQNYPGIQLQILASYDTVNLIRREADIAIRITNNPPEALVGRKIGKLAFGLYCSRVFLERNRTSRGSVPYIRREDDSPVPDWFVDRLPRHHIAMLINDPGIIVNLLTAHAGVGVALCSVGDILPDLVRLDLIHEFSLDLWLLTHEDLRSTARVRTFMDAMAKSLGEKAPLLEGKMGESVGIPDAWK
jgi:DNA-binding transcriptional LysR family regulator